MLETPSQGQMSGRRTVDGLDKRKACVFVILVAIGVLCLGVLGYMLFYAKPHSSTVLKNGGNSMIRQTVPPGTRLAPAEPTVRS
jgi:hypothetical protein